MSALPKLQQHRATPNGAPSADRPRRWRTRDVLVAVAVAVLVAALGGGLVGRATKRTNASRPSPSPTWTAMPRAPIAGRIGEGVVWTGKEMIVWGGVARATSAKTVADGAAYDPAARAWRTLPAAPVGTGVAVGGTGAWTGEEAVFWAGNSPDGPAVAAAYAPHGNRWRRLPAGPLGPRELYAATWTARELLIVGGARGDTFATPVAAALDPRTSAWRVLHGFDRFRGLLPNGAVWNGSEAFITGTLALCPEQGSACSRRRPVLLAYKPATGVVRELALPHYSADFGADTASSLTPVGATANTVVFSAAVPGSVRMILYGAATGTWQKGVNAPCFIPPAYTQAAWLGDRFVAACGADGLQVYPVATGRWTWRNVIPGPSPLNSREGSAIVWTGRQLIAWSGTVYRRLNPTPADGAVLSLGGGR